MNFREAIDRVLAPLMSAKCAMLNLPYYPNPGDGMIWLGMEQFMAKHGVECVYRASAETFEYRELGADVTICFVGGGNLGDLWYKKEEQPVCKVARMYPNNRIVVFPQSVFYESEERMFQDAKVLAQHPDLYICARDKQSYALLKEHFSKNHILLVPDMALYLELNIAPMANTNRTLFLKREDKEACDYTGLEIGDAEISEWPMMVFDKDIESRYKEETALRRKWFMLLSKIMPSSCTVGIYQLLSKDFWARVMHGNLTQYERWQNILCEFVFIYFAAAERGRGLNSLFDWFARTYFMPELVNYAMNFINQYDKIITTRLHSGVMGMQLRKEVVFVDNSYGKISALYEAWLRGEKNVSMKK